MFNDESILGTGGAGSYGKACGKIVLARYPDIKRLVVRYRGI